LRNIYKVVFFVCDMRWRLFVLLGVFLVGFVGATIFPGDCDLSEAMIAYWRMESNLLDSYGNHDAGSWVGTERYGSIVGSAALFMGSESVEISGVSDLDFQFAFTVEFLVNSVSSSDSTLFEKGGYKIEWINGGPGAGSVNASVSGVSVVSPASLSDGINYHVALVWEPVSENLTLYINSVNVGQTSLFEPVSAVGNLILGDGFNGLIDEVAVYDSAFAQSTVNYHFRLLNVGKDYCDPSGVDRFSTTRSDFIIAGCTLPDESGLARGTCSVDGEFYCDDDDNWFRTRDDRYGCSLGGLTYTPGDDYCCPSGLYCNGTAGGSNPVCAQRVEQCSDQLNEGDCEGIGCLWLGDEGLCVESTHDYSCSLYQTQEKCDEDIWNLAKEGIGTEVCGTYMVVDNIGYVIPYDSCACVWDATEPDPDFRCKFGYDVYPDIYGADPDWFKCLKAFDVGECIEGVQDFSWTVDQVDVTGEYTTNASLLANVAAAAGCELGSSVRNCGEPVIRLPGFSLFALFGSVFIIGLFYFLRLGSFK
jgi:hypothetical protein